MLKGRKPTTQQPPVARQLVLKDKIFLGQEIPKSDKGYRNNLRKSVI